MDKRGFIKTLEAVLSIIIVFIFIFTLSQKGSNDSGNVEVMKNIQEGLLMGVNQNNDFRSCIVTTNDGNLNLIASGGACPEIKQYVMDTLPARFAKENNERYAIQVCNPSLSGGSGSCSLPSSLPGKYTYTSAIIISSDLQDYNPRILRIWMW